MGHQAINCTGGSSPRLRGTLQFCEFLRPQHRFIPASAGNTRTGASARCNTTVHPRVCGEHPNPRRRPHCDCGSSPRLRGTHPMIMRCEGNVRFIPASAGNTCSAGIDSRYWTVHPRVCGEHFQDFKHITINSGSSPRLRGTRNDRK